jgi:hypothetical protein
MRLLLILCLTALMQFASASSAQTEVDETLVWNQVMLDAIVAGSLGNPQTIRMAATVNTAMFDAGNAVSRKYSPIFVTQTASPETHEQAAIVQAAYVTLKSFYPKQAERFEKQRALSLAGFARDDAARVQHGLAWGEKVANQVLAWRASDGFSNKVDPFSGAGGLTGQWQSATKSSMSPDTIAFTAPFVLASNTQFQWAFKRPWAALDSKEYAASLDEVATLGVKTSSRRTADQTYVAYFFNGYATNEYIEAAIQLARAHGLSREMTSRVFALLTTAMHDTSVTVFRAKRDFGASPTDVTWRPLLAIRQGVLDGRSEPVSGWEPLIATPNHPEYPASHPGNHGAGARVLQHFFGDVNTFKVHPVFNSVYPRPEGDIPPREYRRISDMAQDGISARTYGGMHFRGASEATRAAAEQIADYVLANAARPASR